MANWGDTTVYTSGWNLSNLFAYLGGISPAGTNTLDSVSIATAAGQTYRVAVYVGGSAGDPSGATLLEDLGTFVHTGSDTFESIASTTNPTVPASTRIWIAVKSSSFGGPRRLTTGGPAGDFDSVVTQAGDNTNGAWPSSLSGSFTTQDFPGSAYLTYSAGGGTTLTVESLSHGHSLDSPTLDAPGTLAPAELAHSHTLDAPTLEVPSGAGNVTKVDTTYALTTSGGTPASSRSVTPALPAGIQEGDLWLLVGVADAGTGSGTDHFTDADPPSGFAWATAQYTNPDTDYPSVRVAYKVAGASESAVAITAHNEIYDILAFGVAFRGQNASSPIGNVNDDGTTTGIGTTVTAPAVTIQADGSYGLLIAIASARNTGHTGIVAPGTATLDEERSGNDIYPTAGLATEAVDAGSYSPGTWSFGGDEEGRLALTIEIRPEPTGGGTTLSVQSLAHAHTLDQPSLTQQGTLTVEDLLHAHALDTVPLAPWVTLDTANRKLLLNGAPWLMIGEAAWSLPNQLSYADALTYLNDRQSKGVNAILVNGPEYVFCANAPNNDAGDYPWTGTAFQSTLNSAYWDHIEAILEAAAARGIVVFIANTYAGFDGTQGWQDEIRAASDAQMATYGTYIGNLLKVHPNVVHVVSGDYDFSADTTFKSRIDAYGAALHAADPDHVITLHPGPDQQAIEPWGGSVPSWLADTVAPNGTYAYGTASVISRLREAWLTAPYSTRVSFGWEFHYEGEWGSTQLELREQIYYTVLTGGVGLFFGWCPGWHFNGANDFCDSYPTVPAWTTMLDTQGIMNMVHASTLFSARPWYDLVPDTDGSLLVDGQGANPNYKAAAIDGGTTCIAYIPTGGSFHLDLSSMDDATLDVWWFNPATGLSQTGGTVARGSNVAFTTPDSADWVLVVDSPSAGYEAPGGISLIVEALAHAQTLDAPSLTQASTLAPEALTHAHALDQPTLVQANVLTLEALLHEHGLDSPTLAAGGTLSVQALDHAHLLDALSLTQANLLVVSPLDHGHALDAVTLELPGSLSVADLSHGHVLDSPALTQAHVLAVAGLLHGHALDSPTLSAGATLAVESLGHAHALEAVALIQQHILAVAGLEHAHTLDAPALVQAGTLVLADLLHGHLLDGLVIVVGGREVGVRGISLAEPRLFLSYAEPRIWKTYSE